MKRLIVGFTLLELMIALVISSVVLLGVSQSFSAIHGATHVAQSMQTAQEVLRFTAELFSRSLKQTVELPTLSAGSLVVRHKEAGQTACDGSSLSRSFVETYTLRENMLVCRIDGGLDIPLISGISNISYNLTGSMVQIYVKPDNWLRENMPDGFRIDVALISKIFKDGVTGS